VTAIGQMPWTISMAGDGRGRVKTQNLRVFGGRFGIPEGSIVEYRAI